MMLADHGKDRVIVVFRVIGIIILVC
jgi:hypothetical protein